MSDTPPALPPAPLDAPLPAELTGVSHSWFTRYRRYPVFSAPWARGRTRAWLVPVGVFIVFLGGGASFAAPPSEWPWAAVLGVSMSLLLPLFIGPWLGVWVRRRGWPPAHEGAGLIAAMVVLVAGMVVVETFVAEPVKQAIARWIGDVDEHGQRRRIALQIGVTVQQAGTPASAPTAGAASAPGGEAASAAAGADEATAGPKMAPRTQLRPFDYVVRGVVAFWLGGGFALLGWRREREGLPRVAALRALAHEQAARREAELRLSVLAAQVEPHFLFNTLAGVRSAITTDPPRAAVLVDRLVDYLRASIPRLRSDGSAEATVGAQFELVRAYLALMAARMPRLAFEVTVPPALKDERCPPLMLISLAENAVKHGVEPKIGPARIEVTARRTADGGLELTVADDGVGFDGGGATAGTGLGLVNIRERLAQLYGGRATLTLKARPGGGVAATLVLPPEPASP